MILTRDVNAIGVLVGNYIYLIGALKLGQGWHTHRSGISSHIDFRGGILSGNQVRQASGSGGAQGNTTKCSAVDTVIENIHVILLLCRLIPESTVVRGPNASLRECSRPMTGMGQLHRRFGCLSYYTELRDVFEGQSTHKRISLCVHPGGLA